jgi:chromosome segregation ATPase
MPTNAELQKQVKDLKAKLAADTQTVEEQQAEIERLRSRVELKEREGNIQSTAMGDLYRPEPGAERPDTVELDEFDKARSRIMEAQMKSGLLPGDAGAGAVQAAAAVPTYQQALEAATAQQVAQGLLNKADGADDGE